MGCCGQKRVIIKNTFSSSSAPAPAPANVQPVQNTTTHFATNGQQHGNKQTNSSQPSLVILRYLENSPILVRGPTGRQYEFSGARPSQSVDARDAEALLRTRFFRRAN